MLRTVRYGIAVAVVGAAVAVAACSGGSAPAGGSGGNSIAVKMTDMKFDPAPLKVKAGQAVTLQLENAGAVPHDLTIKGLDNDVHVVLDPGKKGTASFTASKAGTFKVICTQPGHEAAGMVTDLVVE